MTQTAMSRDQVRDVDRRAIEEYGLPGIVLMENAGRGTAELIMELGIGGRVVICAGKGNNGGDGFVIARHLLNHGYEAELYLFCEPLKLQGDAAVNYHVLRSAGWEGRIIGENIDEETLAAEFEDADWIADALLGTGTSGRLRAPFPSIIRAINNSPANVLAVDLPSGMDCDSGAALGECVVADDTATFVAPKLGFLSPGAETYTGTVHVIDIGVPRCLFAE